MVKKDLLNLGIIANIESEYKKDNITSEDLELEWVNINEKLIKGDYDIVLLGWQLSVIPEFSFAFHSSNINANTNFIKYSNENMDQILEETFMEGNRLNKIKSFEKLQKHIVSDLPYVSLFFRNKALLVDNKIIGELNPIFLNPYKGLEKAYIPKEFQ